MSMKRRKVGRIITTPSVTAGRTRGTMKDARTPASDSPVQPITQTWGCEYGCASTSKGRYRTHSPDCEWWEKEWGMAGGLDIA